MEIPKHILWSEGPRAVDSIFFGEIKRIIRDEEFCGNEEPGIYIEGVEMHFLLNGTVQKSPTKDLRIANITDKKTSGAIKVGAKVKLYTSWNNVGGTTEKAAARDTCFIRIEFDDEVHNGIE